MATVAESLFGVSPESLMAAREQRLQEQAMQFGRMSPIETARAGFYEAGSRLGGAIGGLLGAEDPELMRVRQRQQLLQGVDISDPKALREAAARLMQGGDSTAASELARRALDIESKQAGIAKDTAAAAASTSSAAAGRLTNEQRNAAALADTIAERGTEGWNKAYKEYLTSLTAKAETKSEFERILGSLNLNPEQEKSLKQQWVQAKLNPDPSGMKAIQTTIAGLQAQQLQLKIEGEREKKAEDKKAAIQKLSDSESSLDTALNAADKALKLAPGSFAGATSQALLSSIPWTDAKSLNNLVSTLQSEKVMGTLEQLKSQSRTGATGFGSLTEKELTLLMNRITSLDPTDKMFKENLTTVMEEWKKVQQKVRNSRRELQGGVSVPNAEDLIKRTIEFNKTKGNMSRDQAIQLLKSSGKLPNDY